MSNPKYSPPAREATDGLCPACLGTQVGYDVVSYLSGVGAPDGGAETLHEESMVCYDCGERAALATRGGVQYDPETLMDALRALRVPE